MSESRTINATRNFVFSASVQVMNIVLSFIVRTVFLKVLNESYLGINGLFTNILTLLSFAELGIGNAIIYSLYRPIAENDINKIKGLMIFYRNAYKIIGVTVAILGICIIPLFDFIIVEPPAIEENIIVIYLLFLLNTVSSYFFIYKRSIIIGYQKEYIATKYQIIFYSIRSIAQIFILIAFKNFILYLLIQVLCTIAENYFISRKADKMFPYIKDKNAVGIPREEERKIFTNVKSLILYKVGSIVLNGTDNIIITRIFNLAIGGIVSNYNLVINSLTTITSSALSALTSSIGNLNAKADSEAKEAVFLQVFFISVWIYGFCSIELCILINPFIEWWIGQKYLLPDIVIIAMVLHFYINGIQFAGYSYRTTSGLFQKGKIAPLLAAMINIILSVILGKIMGLSGVFFATSISRLCTTTWIDGYLVHKYCFFKKSISFFKKYIKYTSIVLCNLVLTNFLVKNLIAKSLFMLLVKGISIGIISNIFFLIVFYNNKEFKSLIKRIGCLINR